VAVGRCVVYLASTWPSSTRTKDAVSELQSLNFFLDKRKPFSSPSLMQKVALARCVVFLHLKVALFHKNEMMRLLSGNLVFLLMEGSTDTRKMIESILPKGVFYCHTAKVKAGSRSGLVRPSAAFLLFLPSFLSPSFLSSYFVSSLFVVYSFLILDTRKMIESILPKGVVYSPAPKVKAGSRSGNWYIFCRPFFPLLSCLRLILLVSSICGLFLSR
jgi:hypothetical protein